MSLLTGDGRGAHLLLAPVSETVCYADKEGQQFYLSIGNDHLMRCALERLHALGVRVVDL